MWNSNSFNLSKLQCILILFEVQIFELHNCDMHPKSVGFACLLLRLIISLVQSCLSVSRIKDAKRESKNYISDVLPESK